MKYNLRVMVEGSTVIQLNYETNDEENVVNEMAERCKEIAADGVFDGNQYYPPNSIKKIIMNIDEEA